MISKDKKIIFIHIGKTGGTSIGHAVFGNTYLHTTEWIKDLEASLNLNEYFKFTFVRNPWDRMVSHYYQLKNPFNLSDPQRKKLYAMAQSFSFPEFLRRLTENYPEIHAAHNCLKRIKDSDGNVRIDFIGKFEQIESEGNKLLSVLKVEKPGIEWLNKSKGKRHYTDYYDQASKDIIREFYGDDIEYFGYCYGEN